MAEGKQKGIVSLGERGAFSTGEEEKDFLLDDNTLGGEARLLGRCTAAASVLRVSP